MDRISKVLKRTYTAVFGSSIPSDSPTKQRKITGSDGMVLERKQQYDHDASFEPAQHSTGHSTISARKIAKPKSPASVSREQARQETRTSASTTFNNLLTPRETFVSSDGYSRAKSSPEERPSGSQFAPENPPPVYALKGTLPPGTSEKLHIVLAAEPGQTRPALLMDEELIKTMKTAISGAHQYFLDSDACNAYLNIAVNFQEYSTKEIARLGQNARSLDTPRRLQVREQIDDLVSKSEEAKLKEVEMRQALSSLQTVSYFELLKGIGLVGDAFFAHGLIEAEPEDKAGFQPNADFVQHFAIPEQLGNQQDELLHKDGSPDPDLSQYDRDYRDEENARDELAAARQNLIEAQGTFDRRKRHSAAYYSRRQSKDPSSPEEEEDLLAFDLQQIENTRKLAHELTTAENRLSEAKAAALALHLDIITASQTSGFHDQDGDAKPGARLSGINYADVGAHSGKVDKWVKSLPPVITYDVLQPDIAPSEPEVEAFDMQPICVWDSISLVDEGKGREKIDEVRQMGEEKRVGAVNAWCSVYAKREKATFEKWHKNKRGFGE